MRMTGESMETQIMKRGVIDDTKQRPRRWKRQRRIEALRGHRNETQGILKEQRRSYGVDDGVDALSELLLSHFQDFRYRVPIDSPVIVGTTTPLDGGMKTYKRSNVAFRSGARMTRANAVFVLQAGGTLSNVFIAGGGGVFCELHNCAFVNV
ncbi:hypothetical protein PsorP6_000123 [Peronosclerospora sorghi]|uniref:Uncharacterized protein n=1 Tax=Peronosclerospora sorghi TaxID=230839 RepID=A0ACC0WWZ8_9STRA|nr:hypothetical protein PsorP6_000123 [Peronosclerospora sorghi]